MLPRLDVRMLDSFHRSGGILNLFLDRPTEGDDPFWPKLLQRVPSPDDLPERVERTRAWRSLCREWNSSASVVFSGLSPAQVVAGGGPREAALLDGLAQHLEAVFQQHDSHQSAGELAFSAAMALRQWQLMPQVALEGSRPDQVIRQERDQILAAKLDWLAKQA